MLQLVNISNDSSDVMNLLDGRRERLDEILFVYGLDGIEFFPCGVREPHLFPKKYIKGCHLRFWPNWLDFWRGNSAALRKEFGTPGNIAAVYGKSKENWLEVWRNNIRQTVECGAQYVVFHVANARSAEICTRSFAYDDEAVVDAVIEVVNEIADELPADCWLLFENLWWPGLTFQKPWLVGKLLERVKHENTGFMLDTGHLMNTNTALRSEDEAVCYILQTVNKLGSLKRRILGMHLHQSFSGAFVERMRLRQTAADSNILSFQESMDYISRVDQHRPFCTSIVQHLVHELQPRYLVHEFLQESWEEWNNKLRIQCKSLNG